MKIGFRELSEKLSCSRIVSACGLVGGLIASEMNTLSVDRYVGLKFIPVLVKPNSSQSAFVVCSECASVLMVLVVRRISQILAAIVQSIPVLVVNEHSRQNEPMHRDKFSGSSVNSCNPLLFVVHPVMCIKKIRTRGLFGSVPTILQYFRGVQDVDYRPFASSEWDFNRSETHSLKISESHRARNSSVFGFVQNGALSWAA